MAARVAAAAATWAAVGLAPECLGWVAAAARVPGWAATEAARRSRARAVVAGWAAGFSVKGESSPHRKRHDSAPLVHTTLQSRAVVEESCLKLRCDIRCRRGYASRTLIVCSLHIKHGLSHHARRGSGVVCRKDVAIDQSGGRERAACLKHEIKAGIGRRRDGAAADVTNHLGQAGGGNAGLGQDGTMGIRQPDHRVGADAGWRVRSSPRAGSA